MNGFYATPPGMRGRSEVLQILQEAGLGEGLRGAHGVPDGGCGDDTSFDGGSRCRWRLPVSRSYHAGRAESGSWKQGFRPPAEGEALLFCLSKREVPKRKRHPASAPCRHPCLQGPRPGCGVCRQSVHGLTPNWSASMPTTLRADPPPARRCRGAPGRATRILRAPFRKTRSTALDSHCTFYSLSPGFAGGEGRGKGALDPF